MDVLWRVIFRSTNPNIDDSSIGFVASIAPADLGTAGSEILTAFAATYSGHTLAEYLHPAINRATNSNEIEAYDITGHLDGTPHGSPVAMGPFTIAAAVGNGLPAQLAGVADYHASLTGVVEFGPLKTRPRSRLRGRHYWGPLSTSAVANETASPWDSTLAAGFIDALAGFYVALMATAHFGPGWGVWSRKNAALAPVVGGWVDETVHVQRRRQDPAGVKVFWP